MAQAPSVSPTTDPANGYPLWYQDARGLRLQPCLYTDGTADPFCVLLDDPGFNHLNPLVFPTNFPVEFFYFVADSDKLTTPGCPASSIAAGTAKWRGALEGSFLTGIQQPGQQSTFARTKVVASGLCPNTTYTFTTPFGPDSFTTNSSGQVVANKTGGTIDIGCAAAPCDFSIALTSRVLGGFLQLSPPLAGTVGYLGDSATLGTISGSLTGTNVFSITAPGGALLVSTDLFTVSGKIAGPLMAAPSAIDFAGQVQFTTSAPIPVTITNVYSAPITVTGASSTGANAADFAIVSDGCTNLPLARDASCSISVSFHPSLLAVENATLAVTHDGPFRSPLNVALAGTGIAGGAAPVVSLSAATLGFPNTRVRTTSAAQTVTVTNTGNAPLTTAVTIVNADPSLFNPAADQFSKVTDTCSGQAVAAAASCAVSVQFAPTVATATPSTALLSFADNAADSPQTVTLTGTGTGGLATVSTIANPPGLNIYGYPNWYQDENGVQVQPCLNPAEPCVLLPDAGFNPANPLALPGNFPVEFFYFVADSDKMDVPGCGGAGGAKVTYRAALEGSFLTGVAELGQQSTFTRTKIVVGSGGLCPNTTYAFTHPYGTDLVTADASGAVVANKKGATIDIGCLGAPCDFSQALSSRVFGGLLKWDPAIAPAAPTGFLGDAGVAVATPHAIVGSPFLDPVSGTPANFLRISDPVTGAVLQGCKNAAGVAGPCQVNLFTVSGKLAGPVQAAPSPLSFGTQAINTTSATQTVTLTNTDPAGAASVTINTVAIVGPDLSAFSIPAGTDTCSGVALAANGGSCTIGVAFNPTAAGPRVAALMVTHTGLNTPVEVPLSGTGLAANLPPVAVDDTATTTAGAAVNIAVLPNDSDPDGNLPLTVGSFTQPLNGAVVLLGDNTITYTSNAGFTGSDSFTYQAADSLGALSNPATVTVTVNAPAAATTTTISAPAVTFPANGLVTVTVSSTVAPTGNVSLSVDGGPATSVSLATLSATASSATFTLTNPAVGPHTLRATYAAQGSFAGSLATGTLTVNPAATATAISAPAVTTPSNALVTVTVTSLIGTPTGSVALTVDGGAAISQTLVGGSTIFTLISPTVGNHTVVASYAAQGNFAASVSPIVTLVVNPSTETIAAAATASRNKLQTAASWTINGTTNVLIPAHTMTITLTRTGAAIGSALTDTKGRWKFSAGKSPVVPVPGDTITVTSSLGTTATFPVTVK